MKRRVGAGMQELLLALRRRGRSALVVHHAGNNGEQRGTTKRLDILDLTIKLVHPPDYRDTDGARFEVHLGKRRTVYGNAARSFEARLEIADERALWTIRDVEDADLVRVVELIKQGTSIRDIAEELGMHRSKVGRLKGKAVAEGLLP
jgi:putative DNA primase/helicase